MYPKSVLEKLTVPPLPARKDDAVYRVRAIDYILRCRIDREHKLLIVAFYDREAVANGFQPPTAVLYQSKSEYITRIQFHGTVLWKKGRILHALEIKSDDAICLRPSDEKAVRSFLPDKKIYSFLPAEAHEGDILTLVYRYQTWLIQEKNNKRKKERVRKTDKIMALAPALPDAFTRWADKEPLLNSRYMYYQRMNRKEAGCTCTHCKRTSILPAKDVKHCQPGKCPACGSNIVFKSTGRSHRVWDEGYSAILQTAKNGDFLLRFFQHTRSFCRGWDTPEDNHHECARLFFTGDGAITGAYKYGDSPALGRYGWHPSKDVITGKKTRWKVPVSMYQRDWNDWFQPSFLYPHNVRGMLGRLKLSYSLQKEWCHKTMDVTTAVLQTARYPFAHLLKAEKLDTLSDELYEQSLQLTSFHRTGPLHKCLCVPKEIMPALQKHEVSVDVLNVVSRLKCPEEEDVAWLKTCRELEAARDLLDYTTFHKIKKYSQQQGVLQKKKDRYYSGQTLTYWRDYLQMAKTLGYDVKKKSVLYPGNVLNEHDKLTQLVQVQYDPVVDQKIKNLYPLLEKEYGFEDNDYLVVPPRDFEDFKEEGATLLHCVCVNKYYYKHIQESSFVFFLRRQKKPDVPFYTIQYSPYNNRISQCQGYRHKSAEQKIEGFMQKWLDYLADKKRLKETAA